ncbi:amino acid ABC transporter substrate-binding protein [Clostridium sp. cel8]|jgi:glutamine transport system substrate-binding protein|uniref:substrate-binding periplasmic protein n=1 Tax=unclassified Clostridium TaxID=2614128 RepID=UPI0015F6EEF1|nr:transporter substrate-binding domain-containing protein [Clostridium sp. cel8]MBA5851630.1 amino acid ABC transporter substrate-binding protein [Clostridium sp. cel8]
MKKLLITLITVIFIASLTGCGSSTSKDSTSSTKDNGSSTEVYTGELKDSLKGYSFKIGTSGTYAPFSYYDEDGKTLIGFDMDLLKSLQELLGFEIDGNIQAMDYSPLTTSVGSGKLDIAMAALSATDTRKKVMNFSDTYYEAGLTVIVNKETSPKSITGLDSIKTGKYKIAVEKGTIGNLYLVNNGVPTSSLKVYDSITTAHQALEDGKVDCLVYDVPGTAYYISHKKDSKLKMVGEEFAQDQSPYAIAVSFNAAKKNPKLMSILNAAIQQLQKDGTLDKIEQKWCK